MENIGTVARVRRYPVKSMRGEDVDPAFVAFAGLMGDRIHAFVDPAARPDFPWLTAREMPDLLRWTPRFTTPLDANDRHPTAERLHVDVEDPDGRVCSIADPELLGAIRRQTGRAVSLRSSERGMHDTRPVSLIALESIDAISAEVGCTLDPTRFRANIYVRWHSGRPFEEDTLVDRVLCLGETVRLMVSKRDQRCAIVNLDPTTAERTPSILRTIGQQRDTRLGVYCVVIAEGLIRPGDAVTIDGGPVGEGPASR